MLENIILFFFCLFPCHPLSLGKLPRLEIKMQYVECETLWILRGVLLEWGELSGATQLLRLKIIKLTLLSFSFSVS